MALVQRRIKDLSKIDFVNKSMTAKEVYSKYKPSVFINACLYDMATSTNITKAEDENKPSGYLFSNWGIGIRSNNTLEWVSYNKAISDDDIRDFIAGSPTLVEYGVCKLDWGNKVSQAIQGRAYRSAIGFNEDTLFLFTSEQKMTLDELSRYMQRIGCRWAINLDGGGSCHLQVDQKVYKNSMRKNASWIMLYGKDINIPTKKGSEKMKVFISPSSQEHNVGATNGYIEEIVMNKIADQLIPKLEAYGIEIERNSADDDVKGHVKRSNAFKPDLHLAIHSNATSNGQKLRGCICYICGRGGNAEKYANNIVEEFTKIQPFSDIKDKVQVNAKLYETKNTSAPAVIVEVDFHDNEEGSEWILSHYNEITECLLKATLKALQIEYKETNDTTEDWKIAEYQKALSRGIITDKCWLDRLNGTIDVASVLAMLNNLYERK